MNTTVSTSALTDKEWVKQRMYWKLSTLEAAQDPRTPEEHLMRNGFHTFEWYLACTSRPQVSAKLAGWLIALAASWPGESTDQAAAIVAAADMAACKHTHQLMSMVRGIRWANCDWSATVGALAAHPASTDEIVAWALVNTMDCPRPTAEQNAAAAGSFVPYARRLANQAALDDPDHPRAVTPSARVEELVDMAASVNALFPDPALRSVAARVSLTFNGSPTELAQSVQVATAAA